MKMSMIVLVACGLAVPAGAGSDPGKLASDLV